MFYVPKPKKNEFTSNNLYVKHYPENSTEKDLQAIFEKYGPLLSIKIPIDPLTNKPKGFGYVCFKNTEDAINAVHSENGKDGLFVAYHKSKEAREHEILIERLKNQKALGGQCLFVKGLDRGFG